MSSEITDDLLTLQKNLKVGDLSSRHFAEEMRKKYESKTDQFSSCDVELLNATSHSTEPTNGPGGCLNASDVGPTSGTDVNNAFSQQLPNHVVVSPYFRHLYLVLAERSTMGKKIW